MALGRAQQLSTFGDPPPDAADLAAAYAFGLARNHGFSDGNKRTAWVIARVFLVTPWPSTSNSMRFCRPR